MTTGAEVNEILWYDRQRELDSAARSASESLLGPERRKFANAVGAIARIFDAVSESGSIDDLQTKRRLSVAVHGFNLLWSAWDEALCGRYDAAADHWRSLDETPDFLKALVANPSLANEDFGSGKSRIDIHTARKAVRDAMNREQPGAGDVWHSERTHGAQAIQTFAHISREAVSVSLGIDRRSGRKEAFIRPGGGVVAHESVRLTAISLAAHAVDLLLAVAVSLQAVVDLQGTWDTQIKPLAREAGRELEEALQAFTVDPRALEVIALLRSDEAQLEVLEHSSLGYRT
jgi:hypothetical protein